MSEGMEPARLSASRALAALALRRYPEAEQESRAVLGAQPSWAYGHYLLAHALAGQQDWRSALEQAQQAVLKEPAEAEYHAYLSVTQSATGQPCTEALLEAVRLAPDQGRYIAALAWQRAYEHAPEEADTLLERALALAPEDPSILLQAARTYALLHRYDKARNFCILTQLSGGTWKSQKPFWHRSTNAKGTSLRAHNSPARACAPTPTMGS